MPFYCFFLFFWSESGRKEVWQVMLGCTSGWTKSRGVNLLSQTPGAQKAKGPAWKSCGYGKYIDSHPRANLGWQSAALQLRNMEIWEKSDGFCFSSEIHEHIPTHMHMRMCLGLGFKRAQGKKPWSHLSLQLRKKKKEII